MKASTLVLVTLAIAAATLYLLPASDNLQVQEFRSFKSRFNRVYDAEEEAFRFKIFTDNLKKIEAHNADETQTYKMGVTQFADMTTDEFIQKILVNDLQKMTEGMVQAKPASPRMGAPALPDKVDWRQKGVLNPVKNQGGCGSCWAFSVTGTLESAVAISKSTLLSFSEQQLVDCCGAKGYQCQGCSGAWPEWALNYVAAAGITLDKEYPYTGRNDKCRDVPTAQKYLNTAKPWTMLAQSDLWNGIASTPVSVCLDASNWSLYKSGIFSNCGTTNLNHAVTAIGFDQAEGSTLIRNSWGASWGEQGHIRLKAGNTCGVASHALVANLA